MSTRRICALAVALGLVLTRVGHAETFEQEIYLTAVTQVTTSATGHEGSQRRGSGVNLYWFQSSGVGNHSGNFEIRGALWHRPSQGFLDLEVNELLGEVHDREGNKRLIPTQAYYGYAGSHYSLQLGVLDPAAFIDVNAVANDEVTQFLARPFVNNPTILFPGYVLGLMQEYASDSGVEYRLFTGDVRDIGPLHGEERSYLSSRALARSRPDGAFAAVEVGKQAGRLNGHVGAWYQNVRRGDGSDEPGDVASGWYASATIDAGSNKFLVRAGSGKQRNISRMHTLSIANERQIPSLRTPLAVGIAAGVLRETALGDLAAPGRTKRSVHAELYTRITILQSLDITPDIQYVHGETAGPLSRGGWVLGLRLNRAF